MQEDNLSRRTYLKIMNYIIRKAEIKDAPGVAKVHVETWQSHYHGQVPDDYLANLSVEKRTGLWAEAFLNPKPKTITFIVEESGEILGFCSVGPSRDIESSHETGELYSIYLDSLKQGQGIGSALMKVGLDFLKEQGFKKATLWVLKTNLKTISFYKAKGWKVDGVEKKDEKNGFVFEEIRYHIDL